MEKSYQYYDDGQLKFTQDQLLTNSRFDRAYQYDHVGRQTKALTGQEARGGAATDDRPYNETMAFDTMGHLVQRDIRNWDRGDSMGNPTYTNNRHAGWSYDADGRLTMGNGFYYYDAAGQISSFDDGGQFKTDQQVDGDGRRVRSEQKTFDPNTAQWIPGEVNYYIQSTVLGQVLTEVSDQGTKERTFVYAGGKILAIQVIDANQEIVWEHYDPSDGSYRETDTNGNSINAAEMDPLGADAGLMKPITWPDPSSTGKLEPYYTVPALDSASECVLDGIRVPCEMVTSENSMQCPDNRCGPVVLDKVDKKTGKVIGHELSRPFEAHADGGFGYLPQDGVYTGYGAYWAPELGEERGQIEQNHAGALPQNSDQRLTKDEYLKVRSELAKAFESEKCRDFIDRLVGYFYGAPYDSSEDFLALSDYISNSSDGGVFWGPGNPTQVGNKVRIGSGIRPDLNAMGNAATLMHELIHRLQPRGTADDNLSRNIRDLGIVPVDKKGNALPFPQDVSPMISAVIGTRLFTMLVFRNWSIKLLRCLTLLITTNGLTYASAWRGIIPLQTTRTAVEQRLGKPTMDRGDTVVYDFKNERASIEYSRGPCSVKFSQWNVPRDTVISVWVTPKADLNFKDLGLGGSYKMVRDEDRPEVIHYLDEQAGIEYNVDETSGIVGLIKYLPTAGDKTLSCPSRGNDVIKPGDQKKPAVARHRLC